MIFVNVFGQAKIADFDNALFGNQDVFGFYVAVNETVLVLAGLNLDLITISCSLINSSSSTSDMSKLKEYLSSPSR